MLIRSAGDVYHSRCFFFFVLRPFLLGSQWINLFLVDSVWLDSCFSSASELARILPNVINWKKNSRRELEQPAIIWLTHWHELLKLERRKSLPHANLQTVHDKIISWGMHLAVWSLGLPQPSPLRVGESICSDMWQEGGVVCDSSSASTLIYQLLQLIPQEAVKIAHGGFVVA